MRVLMCETGAPLNTKLFFGLACVLIMAFLISSMNSGASKNLLFDRPTPQCFTPQTAEDSVH